MGAREREDRGIAEEKAPVSKRTVSICVTIVTVHTNLPSPCGLQKQSLLLSYAQVTEPGSPGYGTGCLALTFLHPSWVSGWRSLDSRFSTGSTREQEGTPRHISHQYCHHHQHAPSQVKCQKSICLPWIPQKEPTWKHNFTTGE